MGWKNQTKEELFGYWISVRKFWISCLICGRLEVLLGLLLEKVSLLLTVAVDCSNKEHKKRKFIHEQYSRPVLFSRTSSSSQLEL